MKTLLGCLLCLVLGTAQSFAISGGPFGGGTALTTGVYAGVLTPGPLSPGANSIGLFTVTIPKTGIGTGSVIIFAAGLTYSGSISAIADPDSKKLTGQIDATSTVSVGGGIEVATGKLNGQILPSRNSLSSSSARLKGTSNIQFSFSANNPFTQIGYLVTGFKQSSTVATVAASP